MLFCFTPIWRGGRLGAHSGYSPISKTGVAQRHQILQTYLVSISQIIQSFGALLGHEVRAGDQAYKKCAVTSWINLFSQGHETVASRDMVMLPATKHCWFKFSLNVDPRSIVYSTLDFPIRYTSTEPTFGHCLISIWRCSLIIDMGL